MAIERGDIFEQLNWGATSVGDKLSGRTSRFGNELGMKAMFPYLSEEVDAYIGVRLTAYRNDERWAILIEQLHRRDAPAHNTIYHFGSAIKIEIGDITVLEPIYQVEWDRVFSYERMDRIRPGVTTIRCRTTDIQLEDALKSICSDTAINPKTRNRVDSDDVLRWITDTYPDLLFGTDEELSKGLLPGVEPILRLYQWNHPDFDEPPSANETFQLLADVLVTGDKSEYRPTKKPNTHWSVVADLTDWPGLDE